MKCSNESHKLAPAGMVSRQFDRRFHRFGSGVPEVDPAGPSARDQHGEFLRQHDHVFIVKIGPGHVNQARGLILNGFNDLWMAMPGRHHRNSGREIQEAIAVWIKYDSALAVIGDQGVGSCVRG